MNFLYYIFSQKFDISKHYISFFSEVEKIPRIWTRKKTRQKKC